MVSVSSGALEGFDNSLSPAPSLKQRKLRKSYVLCTLVTRITGDSYIFFCVNSDHFAPAAYINL